MSATDGLIELIEESIFSTLDNSGRETAGVTATRVVDHLKRATDQGREIGYLIVGGQVRAVKAHESEGRDEDSDGPFTVWVVSTYDEETK